MAKRALQEQNLSFEVTNHVGGSERRDVESPLLTSRRARLAWRGGWLGAQMLYPGERDESGLERSDKE